MIIIMERIISTMIIGLMLLSPIAVAESMTSQVGGLLGTIGKLVATGTTSFVYIVKESLLGVQVFIAERVMLDTGTGQKIRNELRETTAMHALALDKIEGSCKSGNCYINPTRTCIQSTADCEQTEREIKEYFSR